MASKRNNFILFFIGHNRTGKSVLAKEVAKAYKSGHKKKSIISFDPQSRFKDVSNKTISQEKWQEFFDPATDKPNIHDTLFILDDYRSLMMSDRIDPHFLKLLTFRNEYGLDFIFITHSPKLIVERISYYITHFALFYTAGDADAFSHAKKVQNIETVAQCRDFVNRYVKEHGRGKYETGKNFPFAFIDLEQEKIDLVNMPKAEINNLQVNF